MKLIEIMQIVLMGLVIALMCQVSANMPSQSQIAKVIKDLSHAR